MSSLNVIDNQTPEPLPKTKVKNGMTYILDEEKQVYFADIEDGEDLGMYAVILMKEMEKYNPSKKYKMMAHEGYFEYLEETNETCFRIKESYLESVTEPEPKDFEERVKWNERHSARGHELAMEELNRRVMAPYTNK